MTNQTNDTHSKFIGYLLWIFGFTGAHRFYYGKTKTGVIWFFTLGLLGIGWLIDLFLIPSMDRQADKRFMQGPNDFTVAWALLTFLWMLGAHRFYLGKIGTGIVFLACTGLATVFPPMLAIPWLGALYDFLTLNSQVDEMNRRACRSELE
jgi:TM2 domain-containing membrane protein YozV